MNIFNKKKVLLAGTTRNYLKSRRAFFSVFLILSFLFVAVMPLGMDTVFAAPDLPSGKLDVEGYEGVSPVVLLEDYGTLDDGLQKAIKAGAAPNMVMAEYIDMIVKIAFGFGSIAAVGLIVFQGIKYITSLGVTQKLDAKNGLVRALGALAILFSSFILFNQLNPELLRVRFDILNVGDSVPVDTSFGGAIFGSHVKELRAWTSKVSRKGFDEQVKISQCTTGLLYRAKINYDTKECKRKRCESELAKKKKEGYSIDNNGCFEVMVGCATDPKELTKAELSRCTSYYYAYDSGEKDWKAHKALAKEGKYFDNENILFGNKSDCLKEAEENTFSCEQDIFVNKDVTCVRDYEKKNSWTYYYKEKDPKSCGKKIVEEFIGRGGVSAEALCKRREQNIKLTLGVNRAICASGFAGKWKLEYRK